MAGMSRLFIHLKSTANTTLLFLFFFTGGDLFNVPASTPLQCAQICDEVSLCVAWAWDSCGTPTCFLKSSFEGREDNICVISSVKLGEVGKDRSGGDMPSMF